jgi:hypothetical protein
MDELIAAIPSSDHLLPEAMERAKEWDPTATLSGIDISVEDEGSRSAFTYVSLDYPKNVLLVYIDQFGGYEVSTKKMTLSDDALHLPELPTTDLGLDSREVVEIAIATSSAEWPSIGSELDRIFIQYGLPSGSAQRRMGREWRQPAWRVFFEGTPGRSTDVYVDPRTEDVIGSIVDLD